jgi:hypothetical protein
VLGEGYVRLSYANSTENILKAPTAWASFSFEKSRVAM